MGDNLAELLYMAWRSALLSSQPDLVSWGNVRDPDVRAAWEAAAAKARTERDREIGRLLSTTPPATTLEVVGFLASAVACEPFTYGEHNDPGDCDNAPCFACTTPIRQGDTVTDWEEGYKHHPTCPTEQSA